LKRSLDLYCTAAWEWQTTVSEDRLRAWWRGRSYWETRSTWLGKTNTSTSWRWLLMTVTIRVCFRPVLRGGVAGTGANGNAVFGSPLIARRWILF